MTRLQTTVQEPPAPPLPSPATLAGDAYRASQLAARPMTLADVNALKARKTELSNQLISAQGRREDVAKELRRTPEEGPARSGLEQRLAVLDTRLAQLETDIAENGRSLAAAPAGLLRSSTSDDGRTGNPWNDLGSGQVTAISIVFTLAVLMPMALAASRALFRRATVQKPAPQILESTARLERMEQAIDAVAVEIERISEGQRFVTQLLAKRPEQAALLEANQEPVGAGGAAR